MAKKVNTSSGRRVADMKFKDFRKILEQNGYELEKRVHSTHAKFTNKEKNHSVVCSGFEGGNGRAGKVRMPIVAKILKECDIRL